VPVTAGQLGHERQYRVPDDAYRRHASDLRQVEETVALGIVRVAGKDRRDKRRKQGRIHLAVAIQLDDHVRALGDRGRVAGHDRSADAEVHLLAKHPYAWIVATLLPQVPASPATRVVDNGYPP